SKLVFTRFEKVASGRASGVKHCQIYHATCSLWRPLMGEAESGREYIEPLTHGSKYELFTKNVKVLTGRKDRPPNIKMNDTFSFLPSNGTFWIHNLSRNDSGEYRLIIFDSNGKQTKIHTLQLSVQGKYVFIS
uniref:Immunoglobulin V-set domain-containing protein n=1 Tax=Oryzias latipes TaxID=8090 RepID=A0A3B3I7B4_ORYLA